MSTYLMHRIIKVHEAILYLQFAVRLLHNKAIRPAVFAEARLVNAEGGQAGDQALLLRQSQRCAPCSVPAFQRCQAGLDAIW